MTNQSNMMALYHFSADSSSSSMHLPPDGQVLCDSEWLREPVQSKNNMVLPAVHGDCAGCGNTSYFFWT